MAAARRGLSSSSLVGNGLFTPLSKDNFHRQNKVKLCLLGVIFVVFEIFRL